MSDAPLKLHLPQAILRVHVAEAEQRVELGRREDVRNGVGVANDVDRAPRARRPRRCRPRAGSDCRSDTYSAERKRRAASTTIADERFHERAAHDRIIVTLRIADCRLRIANADSIQTSCGLRIEALDELYASFNYPDSATDPIQIVRRFARADDREVVGFCAAALAFGRVGERAAVDRASARGHGRRSPPRTSGGSIRAATARRSPVLGPSLDARSGSGRAAVGAEADDRSRRIDRGVLSRGRTIQRRTTSRARSTASPRARSRSTCKAAYGRVPKTARRLLFLSAALGRQALQAAESVPAVDGAARRARSRRLDARVAGQADRAARHARHSRRAAACG